MITKDDINFIETNRHHYDTWVKAQYVKHLDGATRSKMLAMIHSYFSPNYHADLWCQSCIASMVVYLYTQYDKWKAEQHPVKPIVLQNDIDLIGDFIGSIPATIDLAKTQPVEMQVKDSMMGLASLIPRAENLTITTSTASAADIAFDLQKAFAYAQTRHLHMAQAHYYCLGLPIPPTVPRPALNIIPKDVPVFDYVLAPFSRSLPVEQKWQQGKWQQLIKSMPGKSFCLFGAPKYDDIDFISCDNVTPVFDADFNTVCNIMQRCRQGVISVVTGISHLAFALQVKNYLFFNQGAWGKNPEAILMEKNIQQITVDEVLQVLQHR